MTLPVGAGLGPGTAGRGVCGAAYPATAAAPAVTTIATSPDTGPGTAAIAAVARTAEADAPQHSTPSSHNRNVTIAAPAPDPAVAASTLASTPALGDFMGWPSG